MNRRTVICLTFLTLFLIFSLSMAIPGSETIGTLEFKDLSEEVGTNYTPSPLIPPPLPEGPIYSEGQFQYAGLGAPLTTKEYAEGSNRSLQISNFNYLDNRYGEVRLPRQWTGYRLEADVYNLYDQPYFVQGSRENGNFESVGTAWSAQNNAMGDNSTYAYYGTRWGSAYGYSGNGVQTWVEWWSGWPWGVSSYVVWRNAINIQRDDPTYAKLTFRVQVNLISGSSGGRGRMVIYAEIAGIVYRLLLDEHCPNNGQWYQLSISVPADDLLTWSVPGNIDVRLGLGFTGSQTGWDYEYWGLKFDDVTLEVRGLVNPNDTTWLDLVMNSTIAQTAGYGYGSYSLVGTWPNPTTDHKQVVAHWQVTDADARLVQFTYNLTLFITRDATTEQQIGPDGSAFTAGNDPTVYWTTWMYAYQPYFFSQYNLSLTKPTTETWTIANVIDPLFTDRTSVVTTNATHFLLSSSAINDIYGWWNFTFASVNRITSISGIASSYDIGDTLSINVNHNIVTSGQCNITIYDANHLVIHEEAKSLTGSTVVSFSKLFDSGDSFGAGLYTICATYDNGATGSMTRAGFASSTFKIVHATSLDIEEGATQKTVIYGLGTFFVRLTYDDLDKTVNPWVANTTGTVRINGSVDGNFIEFQQFGNLYQAEIDNDLMIPGNYPFVIEADDPYHDYATDSITLLVRSDATLTSPESPGVTLPYDEATAIQVFYEDGVGAGIAGATVTTDWPTGPTGTSNGTAGWYNIIIDTSDQPSPGTYTLTVQALRNYYTTRTIKLTIVVREVSTTIDYTSPGSVPWDEDVVIDFSFFANDADSTVHDGDPITSASLAFQLDGGSLTQGSDYTLANHGDGTYTITLLATSGKFATIKTGYELRIQGNPTSAIYGDATRRVYFNVRSLNTVITYIPPAPKPWGNDVVITLNFTVDDPDSTVHNGENIPGLLVGDVSLTLNGVPLGSFGWTALGGGTYNLTIYSSSISTVRSYSLVITVAHSSVHYKLAFRTITFQILSHQTQVIVAQPDPTPYGQQTAVIITWKDLDTGGSLSDTQLNYLTLQFTNGTGLPNESSLTFILDTSAWAPGTYEIIVTTIPTSDQYLQSSGTLRVTILIHQTALTVLPPEATPYGYTTDITIQWFDLTAGGQISYTEVENITITGAVSDVIFGPLSSWTFTLGTSGLNIGTYSITVTVYAKETPSQIYQHSTGSLNNGLVIRAHRVYVLVTGPAPVPEDGSFQLSVSWTDLDTGLPIDNGTYLQDIVVTHISGPSAPTLPWTELSNLEFTINALGWGRGTHKLNVTVTANSANFNVGFGTVFVVIRVHSIIADVDPIPRVPFGYDVPIIFRVNDSDNNVGLEENHIISIIITGGPSTITLDSTNWAIWVDNGTAGDGIYLITLDVSGWSLGTYSSIKFNVQTSVEYGNGVVNTQITIRPLATSFTYQSPPVVPWGEDGKLIVTFLVDDTDPVTTNPITTPISGAAISIATLTLGVDYGFVYWQNGKYNITFYNSYLTSVQEYQFVITINGGAQYDIKQLDDVPLTVRALFTWLHPTAVPVTAFGDDVIIEVEYIVLDGESSLNGDPIHTGTESIIVTGLDGFNPTLVTWQWIGATSVYRITIDASEITDIQSYKIMISISGSGAGYTPDTIPELLFSVRTVFTALAIAPVDAQAYLDNFTIRITYTVNDPDSSLNGWGIDGQASIIELVEYPGLFYVIPLGNGIYRIVINSTSIGPPGSYLVTVNTTWVDSPPPYDVQTRQLTLFVTTRPTTIRNTIGGEFGYLDEIRVNFTYSDQLRTQWILNTSYGGGHVLISVYNTTPVIPVLIDSAAWYVVSLGGTDAFQLRIDADYFGRVGSFDFKVEITWQSAIAPYFVAKEFEFRTYVYGQRTDIIITESAGATPYDSNIIIEFKYITEQGAPINQTDYPFIDISLICGELPSFGIQGTDWNYTFEGNGLYRIWIDTTRLSGIGTYTFFFNVTYPEGLSPFLESQYNEPTSRRVRNINTLLTFIDPGSLFSGDDLNITVRYWNLDNNSAVYFNPPITYIISGGTVQSSQSLGGGWWEFIIDTSGLAAGAEFDIWVYAHQNFYTFQNISIPVYIFEVPLEIDLLSTGVITRYFGETPFPLVIINLTIGAGSDINEPVTDASVIATWDHGTLVFVNEYNGTYWVEISSLFDKGAYFVEINASKVGYFQEDIRIISYTITAGPSQLTTYFCGPTTGDGVIPSLNEGTSFILYAGHWYFIGVWFKTLAGDNITGAIVTYSSAFTEIPSGSLTEISPGIYGKWFDSSSYGKLIYSMEVVADTAARNVQSQRFQFQLDVRYAPAKMIPVGGTYFISVEYFDNFTITIYLNDTLTNSPISSQNITATWGPLPSGSASLNPWTGGYYNYTFPATLAAGFTYELHLDFNGPGSFDCPRTTLTIQIIPRTTKPIDQTAIVSVRDEWNNTISILQVPVGDWLYIYLNYTDADGIPILDGEGAVVVGDVSVPGAFHFDADEGLYVAMLNASLFGRGTHSLRVTISKTNYESKVYTTNFEVIRIPTQIRVTQIQGENVTGPDLYPILYIGVPVSIQIFLLDTWHNQGVENANITLPTTLVAQGFQINELGNGYYEVVGTYQGFSLQPVSVVLTITAVKNEPVSHDQATLEGWSIDFHPQTIFVVGFYGGIFAAVILIVALLGWVLWSRVFSIPWEVRRMRSLAKSVEKEEGYKLSSKDLKRFHDKEITLKDKVTVAMGTVGVAATPAMIPAIAEVEEITATEEDIMGELDKIPGLGPEEKAVLADEMRKIPRKDRIWFLDDLRKQMGQRRMDFLTTRERPVKPEPTPPEVTPPAPEEPKLEEVKPKEPPPSKALTEDRTAPTVLPPDLQPAPAAPPGVITEIRRELNKIPGLSKEEKAALIDHLQYLSKEERQATYRSLRMSADSNE
ncbi:MAG: hypothetical protein ACFE9O_11620 [Promethearchaeota archaeon]